MNEPQKRRGRKPKAKTLDVYFSEPEVVAAPPPAPAPVKVKKQIRRRLLGDDIAVVNIKLTKDVAEKLSKIADSEVRSRSAQIAKVLQDFVKSSRRIRI